MAGVPLPVHRTNKQRLQYDCTFLGTLVPVFPEVQLYSVFGRLDDWKSLEQTNRDCSTIVTCSNNVVHSVHLFLYFKKFNCILYSAEMQYDCYLGNLKKKLY